MWPLDTKWDHLWWQVPLSTEQSCLPNIRNLLWEENKTNQNIQFLETKARTKQPASCVTAASSGWAPGSALRQWAREMEKASPDHSSMPPSAPDVSLRGDLSGLKAQGYGGYIYIRNSDYILLRSTCRGWISYKSSLRKEGLIWDHNLRRQPIMAGKDGGMSVRCWPYCVCTQEAERRILVLSSFSPLCLFIWSGIPAYRVSISSSTRPLWRYLHRQA